MVRPVPSSRANTSPVCTCQSRISLCSPPPSGHPLATGMKRRRHDHVLMAGKHVRGFATRIGQEREPIRLRRRKIARQQPCTIWRKRQRRDLVLWPGKHPEGSAVMGLPETNGLIFTYLRPTWSRWGGRPPFAPDPHGHVSGPPAILAAVRAAPCSISLPCGHTRRTPNAPRGRPGQIIDMVSMPGEYQRGLGESLTLGVSRGPRGVWCRLCLPRRANGQQAKRREPGSCRYGHTTGLPPRHSHSHGGGWRISHLERQLRYRLRLTSVAVHQPPGGERCCSERTLATLADVPADRPCQRSLPSVRRDRPNAYRFIVTDRDQFAPVRRKKQFADHGNVSPSFDDQTGCAFWPEGAWISNRRDRRCLSGCCLAEPLYLSRAVQPGALAGPRAG